MSNVSIINNCSDLTESNAPNNFDVKKAIVDLCAMDPEEAKGNSRTTGVPLPNLKAMAKHLGLGQSFAQPKLIENIIAKVKKLQHATIIENIDNASFRKDKNTFLDFNLQYFNVLTRCLLQRSSLVASRMQLQNIETNEKNPIFFQRKYA
jgi:hypothetical protein